MDKTKLIVGLIGILVIIVIVYLVFSVATRSNPLSPAPTPLPTSAIISVYPSIPEPTLKAIEEDIKKQAIADYNYATDLEKQYTDFPWLEKLPLRTDTYFIYFDANDKKFYGQIYNKGEGEEALKEQITNALKELDIPVEQYEIVWQ